MIINGNDQLKLIFLGDSLQRIYGFIGAVPNLIRTVTNSYAMKVIKLNQNYRFKDNQQMLLLDSNIRKNAENPKSPNIQNSANIYFLWLTDQYNESLYIINKVNKILEDNGNVKIAILAKSKLRILILLLMNFYNITYLISTLYLLMMMLIIWDLIEIVYIVLLNWLKMILQLIKLN